jgi:tetratricopeptide (TPR) repeat protein
VQVLQKRYEVKDYAAVISGLYPDGLQRLRGKSLRRGYILLAASYENVGRLERSMALYQVAARLFPEDHDVIARLGQFLQRRGMSEQAKPLYEKILKMEPDDPYAHLGLAEIYRDLGFLDRSADHYEQALRSLADQGGVWQQYAELLYALREYRTAELALRRAEELGLRNEDLQTDFALVWRALGRYDEALAALEPQVRAGKLAALRARALWLMEAGREREAQSAVAAVLRVSASDPLALYVRARLHLKAGRKQSAREDLLAVARSDNSPFTAQVCAELAALLDGVQVRVKP